jgi:hypothetical protein
MQPAVSIYVLHDGNISLECDMEYGEGKDVVCIINGVSRECIEEMMKRSKYHDYVRVEEGKLYISTSIFKAGKTPGELIKNWPPYSAFVKPS